MSHMRVDQTDLGRGSVIQQSCRIITWASNVDGSSECWGANHERAGASGVLSCRSVVVVSQVNMSQKQSFKCICDVL